ncbi:UNVERIFIED_CONTAM: hypothetical protein FKN15_039689, partial [Acipenser sinensis]
LCVQAAIYFTKEPKSQDALHGRSAILRCEVENPTNMAFDWWHDGVPVQDSERRFKESSNLKFTAVDRHEDAGNFQCVATNTVSREEARSTNASFNIKWLETGVVTLKEPPTVTEIQSSSPVTLRCNIDGHPRPTCQWFKDGSKLTDKIHQINNKERTLTLKSASPDDNGVYYCCAKNAVGQICSSDNFTLSIIDESYPQPLIIPRDQVVNRNEEAMFHCQFTAQPPPVQEWFFEDIEDMMPMKPEVFTADTMQRVYCRPPQGHPEPTVWWEREGVRIPSSGRVYSEGKELIFSPIEGGDSGTYTCLAENKAGLKKQDMTITVATKPEWVTKPMDSQLEEGKPGFLHCQAKATPDPQVTWYRNSIDISDDGRFKIFPNGTLCIHKVEVYDGTIYQCSSGTPAGRIDGQARVHVLERLKFTPPPQPLQCMELDKETSVQCSATGREKPTIQWIKAGDGEMVPYVEHQGGILHFTKVTRSDAGNYTCIASNSQQGEIRAMVHLNVAEKPVTKSQEENGQTPYKMIQTIGLSVGAAVAYIIVVLGLMFYCKKRRNAKRLQKGPEEEEPEMECLNGGSTVQQNGQTTAEIQEEVALTNMGTTVTANKRHSSNDKIHFLRTNLQTITTLASFQYVNPHRNPSEIPDTADYMQGDLKQFLKIAKSKDEKIKPQPISTKQKVSICGQVAMGMEHLSNHRFVHKDLAARNCLISTQRQVKVSALGLSKDVYNSEYYHFRQAWIPLRWLPAESIFEDDFSTKSDVWSFGVLMWEVFTHGEQPYIKLTDDEVLAGLQGGKMKLPAPEGCPSKLYKLMVRCWAPSPKDRPSFSELANALGEIPADSKA